MFFGKNYAWEENEKEIGIYLPGGEGWFRYALRRITKPYIDGGTHQNQDLWRLHKTFLYQKEQEAFSPVYDFPVTNNGEWECAVKIEGTPDFHGGFHGYEKQIRFALTPEAEKISFWQESRILLQGTRDEPVAFHRKEYLFCDGKLSVKQYLEWERTFPIDRAFLAMLPIRRKEGAFLISDTACFQGEEYDVSREGHRTPVSSGSKLRGKEICMKGKESGIVATVTFSEEKPLFVQNTEAYNKVYFFYTQKSEAKKGDVWQTETKYSFGYKKP